MAAAFQIDTLPVTKLNANIAALSLVCPKCADTKIETVCSVCKTERQFPNKLFVLILSGSFNPVHSVHVNGFEAAKQELKKRIKGCEVVAGYLAPSSDFYVNSKLGKEAMPLGLRNKLCKLATSDSSWLDVCPFGLASSSATAKHIKNAIDTFERAVSPLHTQVEVVEMWGADHIVKYEIYARHKAAGTTPIGVVMGRGDDTALCAQGIAKHRAHHLVLVDPDLYPALLSPVSSTAIRKLLGDLVSKDHATSEGAYKELVERKCWLHAQVAQTLMGGRKEPVSMPMPASDTKVRRCRVPDCEVCAPGAAHYCKLCGDKDSTHRSANCPQSRG
jgi:nicotinic acid mononucleotide adenylyltransferase